LPSTSVVELEKEGEEVVSMSTLPRSK